MAQITLRLPDELLEEIDDATGPETSRSEWLRNAARARLSEQGPHERLDRVEARLDRLESEVDRPLWERVFR